MPTQPRLPDLRPSAESPHRTRRRQPSRSEKTTPPIEDRRRGDSGYPGITRDMSRYQDAEAATCGDLAISRYGFELGRGVRVVTGYFVPDTKYPCRVTEFTINRAIYGVAD